MAINDISLSASMRSNLLSLKETSNLLSRTQERLSTGKKVNSAMDNPSSYFTAQSLNNRANDLNNLLDSMGQAVKTIETADQGITSITGLVEQAQSIAEQAATVSVSVSGTSAAAAADLALDVEVTKADGTKVSIAIADAGTVAETVAAFNADTTAQTYGISAALDNDGKLVITSSQGLKVDGVESKMAADIAIAASTARDTSIEQYNTFLEQIDSLVKDASYKGVNLLNGDDLTVNFNEDRTSYLKIEGADLTSIGLGLNTQTAGAWNGDGINNATNGIFAKIDAALGTLRGQASTFGQNLSVVETRQDFTENLINILTSGADALTLADMNEEAANMLALQTRQSLGTNALSMASQADQSVLALF